MTALVTISERTGGETESPGFLLSGGVPTTASYTEGENCEPAG